MNIKVNATDVPRDTLVAVLAASRSGRGEPSRLTQEVDGYYYAVVDHPGVVVTFTNQLDAMSVRYVEVESLPRRPRQPQSNPFAGSTAVGQAFDQYLVALLQSATAGLRRYQR